MNIAKLLFLSLLVLFTTQINAEEQILSFHSDIKINSDSSLKVVETIKVKAENRQINRGIYRDFPTIYKDALGTIRRVGFNLLSVKKDGVDEAYDIRDRSNGKRIYIGQQNVFLKPGFYTYQIEYQTTRQLGFFDDYDELYWNVTGNGWSFPIQLASATVTLPQAVTADKITMTGYTGEQGSTEQYLTHHIVDSSRFHFEITRPLQSRQGLTVVLNWPKGIVSEPTTSQQRENFIQDNLHNVIAVMGLLAVIIYYLFFWLKVGKDPQKGVVIPLYQAPDGFSPASTRFINNMAYDKSCFTTALVSLAVKGAISIDQDNSKKFVVSNEAKSGIDLAAGEQIILENLFKESDQITLTQSEHKRLGKTIGKHETSLREDYEKLYFLTNRKFYFPGILLSLAAIIYSFSKMPLEEMVASTVFVGVFTLMPFILVGLSFRRYLKRRKAMSLFRIAFQLGFFGIFFFSAGDILRQLMAQLNMVAWPVLISAYLILAANILFQQWLKAPTLAGRKLLDQIEGFKLYLELAEEDELKLSGQPKFTTDIYEKFLPFAIALGVEHNWTKKLEHALAAGTIDTTYKPHGFRYYNQHQGLTGFSDSLSGSLDSAISASSTAPGSSSGSSSGSSGGGGGGGGGGGW